MDRGDISPAEPNQDTPEVKNKSGDSKSETSIHLERVQTMPPADIGFEDSSGSWAADSPNNPRNWPKWKKNAQILMVAFHSMMSTFLAAGIVPAYKIMAEEYGVTEQQTSYLTSIQILLLGICPLFWKPISAKYGRHHINLVSVLGSFACSIGGAKCTTYGSQMATRVITGILISPPIGIGSGVVTELCEPHERAQKLGWWTLMTTIGTPAGPFFMGFVVKHIGITWIFWVFAIINFVQFLFYLAIGEETVYLPENDSKGTTDSRNPIIRTLVPRRIDPSPFKVTDFISPLFLGRLPRVVVPSFSLAIAFCYGNIAIIVEMPTAFGQKFNFDAQQVGLQFIAVIIGCFLGEQLGGPVSDWFLGMMTRRKGYRCPADRLWLSYIGYATIFAGLLTWGFQLQKATTWNVTPCVGAAIASFGNQALVTTLTAFAVDSHKDLSTTVGVFVNICRQIYGFIGPFYFEPMFEAVGLGTSSGIFCAIVGGASLLPIIAIHFASRGLSS